MILLLGLAMLPLGLLTIFAPAFFLKKVFLIPNPHLTKEAPMTMAIPSICCIEKAVLKKMISKTSWKID